MRAFLAPAHLALTIIIVIWDVVLAGRIAQNRQAPRVFQAVCGLAALLLDVVGPASHDFRKAVDVFARRLSARDIKSDIRGRG